MSASATINLDQAPPLVSITSPTDRSIIPSTNVAVNGLANDALSGIASISCNGTPASLTSGGFSCSLVIVQGVLSINVSATDVAGNTSSTSITVNLQGPKLTITSPAPLSLFTTNSTTVAGDR